MNNEKILNDKSFISAYVILMFFFPIFFFLYLFSFQTLSFDFLIPLLKFDIGQENFIFLFIAIFIIISVLLLVFIGKAIHNAKDKENYMSIISCTMIVLPFLFVVMNNFYGLGERVNQITEGAANLNIKIITSAILMSIIYMNLIITNVVSPYEIQSNKMSLLVPSLFLVFFLLINNSDTISKIIDIILETIQKSKSLLFKYGILYFIIFLVGVILYMATLDSEALTNRSYIYSLTAILPLLLLFSFIVPFGGQNSPIYKTFLMIILGVLFAAVVYSYSSLNKQTFSFVSYALNFLLFFIILFGLTIFFYIFGNYFKSLNNFSGFIVYFIFYIPCLIIDFFKYLLKEFRMTSLTIYVLFLIEVLLILSYFYSNTIINFLINKTSKNMILLPNTAFLDIKSTIGNSYDLRVKDPISSNNSNTFKRLNDIQELESTYTYSYRKRYAISMWVYLNNQPPNNMSYSKETEIFNYGNGKPKITYYNDITTDNSKDKFIFYFTDSKNKESNIKMTLPGQKWNYIVFNYYSDKVDLFINGNLEKTYVFDNNAPIYSANDNITIGTQDGLDGAICNINYYTEPLTKTQVINAYNLLVMKNPPTLL